MRPSLTTPILRTIVSKLATFELQLSDGLLKADNYIKSNRFLSDVLKPEDDLKLVRPFLNEKLIKIIVKECAEREKNRDNWPTPGNLQAWLEEQSLREAARACKCPCAKKVS